MVDSFLVKPLTYCGCPFIQAIQDRQAKLQNQPEMSSQKVYCEWKTKSSMPLSQDQLEAIRMWKINLIDDFTQDLIGN